MDVVPFADIYQAFSYIESFTNFEKLPPQSVREFKLNRMEELLHTFGDPHKKMNLVHVAGSKGKGSTSTFLSSIFESAGKPTALYTSPHVSSYKERISEAGKQFNDAIYVSQIERIREYIAISDFRGLKGGDDPTTFELLTLLAFLVYQKTGMEWGIIETGMGGRLDATNVILPEASILTSVEFEHTDLLGDTIAKIATEKAGIIKTGVPVFSANQQYFEAAEVFKQKAREVGAPIFFLDEEVKDLTSTSSDNGTRFSFRWKDGTPFSASLKLLGDFQAENAALAATCAKHLLSPLFSPEKTRAIIKDGLERTTIPGRMEIVSRNPALILDGAHTPVSATRVLSVFSRVFPGKKVLIFGCVAGKDGEKLAEILAPAFDSIIITTPGTFRQSNPEALYEIFKKINLETTLQKDPLKALTAARALCDTGSAILVTGSFYLIGEMRKILGGVSADNAQIA